jgi:hypothetical protein
MTMLTQFPVAPGQACEDRRRRNGTQPRPSLIACKIRLSERLALRVTYQMARALANEAHRAGQSPSQLIRTLLQEAMLGRMERNHGISGGHR